MEIFLFFFYQKHLFFLFYFEREKKDEKVRKEEKEKKEKKAYTSQICFFYGCKKLLFWLLSIVYTFLIAGKGQQCLTIFLSKILQLKKKYRVGTAFLFFISFFS